MGIEKPHDKVKLIIPVLYSDESIFKKIAPELTAHFGKTDFECEPFLFTFTNYYDQEMDGNIYRIFLSYEKLIEPEGLVDVKKITNQIELAHAVDGKRKVNLDPGYLELGKFVLATTKDQQHRLYILDGIFEDNTLFYRDKQWQHWEWTYPDYRSEKYKEILEQIREIYKGQLRSR